MTDNSPDSGPAPEPADGFKGPRGDTAWQAARQRVADRNAKARKQGKQDRREHELRIARYQQAARDPDAPPNPPA